MPYDVLFRNARVLDGTGSPWFSADVAVAEGRIAAVGRALTGEAVREIDVAGQILAPGFYDMHSHADISLLVDPRHEGKVFQGVTFELLGQDGLSYAPVTPETLKQVRRHLAGLDGDDPRAGWDWTTVDSYLQHFERTTAVNVGYLVPHNAVRIGAMGWEMRTATAAELDRMRGLVREGMEDGAFGLSTALTYPPLLWSDTDEMVAMCEVVAKYGGIYVTHLRGQGDALLDPIREAIEICQRAGLPLHISHLKSSRLGGPTNLPGLLELLNGARADGLDLTFDSYQYNCGSGMLHAQLPDWTHAGGPDVEMERLRSPEIREQIRQQWAAAPPNWDKIILASVPSAANHWMEGQSLGVLIADSSKDAVDFICDLLLAEDLGVSHVSIAGVDDDPHLGYMLELPYQMAGSDGIHLGSKPHPRTYGTYARVLQRYVREQGLLRLEDAIRKMSSFPARRLSIPDRGEIREGMWADLVVFDPDTVTEQATYPEPKQLATGFSYVAVNGTLVLDGGKHTGATPGRALRLRRS
jgi:N-acyl-D-amino-acid deacylase